MYNIGDIVCIEDIEGEIVATKHTSCRAFLPLLPEIFPYGNNDYVIGFPPKMGEPLIPYTHCREREISRKL